MNRGGCKIRKLGRWNGSILVATNNNNNNAWITHLLAALVYLVGGLVATTSLDR